MHASARPLGCLYLPKRSCRYTMRQTRCLCRRSSRTAQMATLFRMSRPTEHEPLRNGAGVGRSERHIGRCSVGARGFLPEFMLKLPHPPGCRMADQELQHSRVCPYTWRQHGMAERRKALTTDGGGRQRGQ